MDAGLGSRGILRARCAGDRRRSWRSSRPPSHASSGIAAREAPMGPVTRSRLNGPPQSEKRSLRLSRPPNSRLRAFGTMRASAPNAASFTAQPTGVSLPPVPADVCRGISRASIRTGTPNRRRPRGILASRCDSAPRVPGSRKRCAPPAGLYPVILGGLPGNRTRRADDERIKSTYTSRRPDSRA